MRWPMDDTVDALHDLYQALVHSDGAAQPRQLAQLLGRVPRERRDEAICRFADAVIARTGDIAAADIAHRAAATALASDPAALCAVLSSWLGIALVRRDVELIFELRERSVALGDAGFSSASVGLVATIDAIAQFAVGNAPAVEGMLVGALAGGVPTQLRGVIAIVRALALQAQGLLDSSVAVLDADDQLLGSFDLAAAMMRARVVWVHGEHARARAMIDCAHADAKQRGRQHDLDTAAAIGRLMARHDGDRPELPAPLSSTPLVAAMVWLDSALALLPDYEAVRAALLDHPEICTVAAEFLGVPYVLCPEYREGIDRGLGPQDPSDVITVARLIAAVGEDAARARCEPWMLRNVLRSAAGSPEPDSPEAPAPVARLRVLGVLSLDVGATTTAVRRERVRLLLAALALQRRMTRERLIDLLWPDLGEDAGANNLRTTLTYARQLVPGVELLRTEGRVVSLGVEVDLWGMDAHAVQARQAEVAGDATLAAAEWAEAAAAVGGRFAEDAGGPAWLESARRSVDAGTVDVLLRAAAAALAEQPLEARRWAELALQIDPWSDRAAVLVARSWAAEGDRTATRRAIDRAEELFRDLGVEPPDDLLALVG